MSVCGSCHLVQLGRQHSYNQIAEASCCTSNPTEYTFLESSPAHREFFGAKPEE